MDFISIIMENRKNAGCFRHGSVITANEAVKVIPGNTAKTEKAEVYQNGRKCKGAGRMEVE